MRRKEFTVEEQAEIDAFLQEMSFGFLGTHDEEGWPHVTPLNFVYYKGDIYFHGSKIGEKMRSIAADKRVSFAVAKEFALIPSYWSDPTFACPATAFFKSVHAKGKAELVTELAEKAEVFTAFMQKLQPEGGYEPIDPTHPGYAKHLAATAIVKLTVEAMSAKFKFGQNWPETKVDKVSEALQERGKELDEETARLMKLYCPHHRS